jgi:hypothetical protein
MRKRLPEGALPVSQYIKDRVDDQIKWYRDKAQLYERYVERARIASLVLGAIAVILSVISATGWTAGWIAAITTITASIAAYLYSGRYQYLILSYQATARRLEALKTRWEVDGKPEDDPDKRNQFIQNCKDATQLRIKPGWPSG